MIFKTIGILGGGSLAHVDLCRQTAWHDRRYSRPASERAAAQVADVILWATSATLPASVNLPMAAHPDR